MKPTLRKHSQEIYGFVMGFSVLAVAEVISQGARGNLMAILLWQFVGACLALLCIVLAIIPDTRRFGLGTLFGFIAALIYTWLARG